MYKWDVYIDVQNRSTCMIHILLGVSVSYRLNIANLEVLSQQLLLLEITQLHPCVVIHGTRSSLLFLPTDIPSETKCDQVSPMCNSLKSLWPLHTPPATQCLCDHALFTHETGTICCRIVDIFAQISSNSAHKGTSNPEIQETSKIPVAVLVQWYWTTLTKSLHPRVWPNGSQC